LTGNGNGSGNGDGNGAGLYGSQTNGAATNGANGAHSNGVAAQVRGVVSCMPASCPWWLFGDVCICRRSRKPVSANLHCGDAAPP